MCGFSSYFLKIHENLVLLKNFKSLSYIYDLNFSFFFFLFLFSPLFLYYLLSDEYQQINSLLSKQFFEKNVFVKWAYITLLLAIITSVP